MPIGSIAQDAQHAALRSKDSGDRLPHGMELLGDLGAAPAVLDHRDDAEEMSVRPLQMLDDVALSCMSVRFCHT